MSEMEHAPFMCTIAGSTVEYLSERHRNRSLMPNSVSGIRYALYGFGARMGEDRDPNSVTRAEMSAWLADLGGAGQAAKTLRCKVSAVRGLYAWLASRELVDHDPTFGLQLPRLHRSVPRALEADQVAAIFAACSDTRETLIASLMVQEGLRAGEVARLEFADVRRHPPALLVKGKGGHERVVPLTSATQAALGGYLVEHPQPGAGPVVRSYHDDVAGINRQHISHIMTSIFYRAGLKARARDGMSGHALRHTAASDVLVAADHDVRVVQEFLGHASVATTQVYLRAVSPERLRLAVEGRDYRPPRTLDLESS